LGFGDKWRNWISLALSTSSSRILLNCAPGKPLKHERGRRQGGPISHMLFILVMDPLQRILQKASENGHLQSICPRGSRIKALLYADDVAIFVKPVSNDIAMLKCLLDTFRQVSGLKMNLQKSENFPISSSGIDLDSILHEFPVAVKEFPCRHLGLPLHTRKLMKIDYVPLLDKVGGKLPEWKGKLMTKAARAQCVNSVLIEVVTYHATVLPLPKWLIKKIDQIRRNFF
jgi:hypothetical protein